MKVFAVPPEDLELVSRHLAGDVKKVSAAGSRTNTRSRRFAGKLEHRGAGEDLIELPKVIETDLCARQRAQLIGHFCITAQVTQQAIAYAALWYRAHLFFNLFQRRS